MAKRASSGHKLGQIIGDWYEEYFAYPILEAVAKELNLYLDSRFKTRVCRGEKLIWEDVDGNKVDYDFVLELGGTDEKQGIPVAFFETFWRRGSRHSKDKARDDTGKLLPMKSTFPTTRVLGVVAAGDFTTPAKDLILSRGVDLFYVAKENVISAWKEHDLIIDYSDESSETEKKRITNAVVTALKKDPNLLKNIAHTLGEIITPRSIESYKLRLIGRIGAIPQKYTVQVQSVSSPIEFRKYTEMDSFLKNGEPKINSLKKKQFYNYQVEFTDGDEFVRENLNWDELKSMHENLKELIKKME
ncbi:MAG: hypothetical protein LPK80_01940 [Bacteroidota bacterium]|nr:hypothetical protein [Bacteroidota bacterium]MDX5449141.1 hypothetical protein [Bacteroidota bacterium]